MDQKRGSIFLLPPTNTFHHPGQPPPQAKGWEKQNKTPKVNEMEKYAGVAILRSDKKQASNQNQSEDIRKNTRCSLKEDSVKRILHNSKHSFSKCKDTQLNRINQSHDSYFLKYFLV